MTKRQVPSDCRRRTSAAVFSVRLTGLPSVPVPLNDHSLITSARSLKYSELLRLDIPIYMDNSPIDPTLNSVVPLLRHAGRNLQNGNNDGVLIDVRKAITNYLLTEWDNSNMRILNSNLVKEILNRSPTEVTNVYHDIIIRMQEGLRAILKIADRF